METALFVVAGEVVDVLGGAEVATRVVSDGVSGARLDVDESSSDEHATSPRATAAARTP